jgi:uncharacterized protein (TIGR00251 family)
VHQLKFTETNGGTVIEVYVKPNSPRFKVAVEGGEIVVYSTEEPVKGKVNKEILKELGKFFHVQVELVSGATSQEKRLLIKGLGKGKIENLFLGN